MQRRNKKVHGRLKDKEGSRGASRRWRSEEWKEGCQGGLWEERGLERQAAIKAVRREEVRKGRPKDYKGRKNI
jgi:hypothetical protein